jgi:hypothetical protein
MDERFRGKGIWVIAGIMGIVFLCLMLCGLGAMVTTFTRSEAVYIQPPADDGAPAMGRSGSLLPGSVCSS